MKKIITKSLTLVLLVVLVFSFTGCAELLGLESTETLPKFKNFEEMIAYMQQTSSGYAYGLREGGMAPAAESAANDSAKDSSQSAGSHGETNVQVEGVDEADVIKNDGRYIYFIAGNNLVIVDALDPANMSVAGKIVLDGGSSFSEMFITGNTLTAIGYTYEDMPMLETTAPEGREMMPGRYIPVKNYTFAKVYDISDKTNPVMTREYLIEGYPLSSRMTGGKLYLVTNKWAYFYGVDGTARAEDILPYKYDSTKDGETTMIDASDVAYLPNPVDNSFMNISVMDVDSSKAVEVETVMGGGSTIYMSTEALYIVKPVYYFFPLLIERAVDSEGSDTAVSSETQDTQEPKTQIFKYDLTANSVKYAGTGEVRGDVLNQFSMDEYNGFFRIATTLWTEEGTVNNVYILDKNMNNTGSIEKLAPGERIYSVRFSGSTGYVVTFRNMDPLFVLDLSNPANPRVTGELKIPGFSNYLHIVGENYLLGIGVDTREVYTKDENGKEIVTGFETGGLKLSLFDVSDPYNPQEIDVLVIGKQGSYSEAQYNHKAFTWWPEKQVAMFSAQINTAEKYGDWNSWTEGAVIVDVNNGRLSLRGILPTTDQGVYWSYYTPTRVTYINDTVYYLQMGKIRTFDFNTLAPISELQVADLEPIDYPMKDIMPIEEPMPVPAPDDAD
jgi:uncharacterized secreted protein with C-terminal beta-propeller domain